MVIRNFILTLISSLSLTMFSYCSKSSDEDNLFVEVTLGKNGLVSVVANDDNVSNYRFSFDQEQFTIIHQARLSTGIKILEYLL